jgi:hypothetical protein
MVGQVKVLDEVRMGFEEVWKLEHVGLCLL